MPQPTTTHLRNPQSKLLFNRGTTTHHNLPQLTTTPIHHNLPQLRLTTTHHNSPQAHTSFGGHDLVWEVRKITLNSQSHPLVAEWAKVLGFPLGDLRLEPRFDYFLSFRLALFSRFQFYHLQRPSPCRARSPLVKNHACLRINFYITCLQFFVRVMRK